VKRQAREELPDGGYTLSEWDDEEGHFDLTEYDAGGGFVRRIHRQYVNPDASIGELLAEDALLDADGAEIERRQVIRGETDPAAGGWS
jgi:hypothetical protein